MQIRKHVLVLILFFIASILIYAIIQNQNIKQIAIEEDPSQNYIYIYKPVFESSELSLLENPATYRDAKTSPQDANYFFTNFLEKYNQFINSSTVQIYPEKRITELAKWGMKFQLLKDYKNVDQLKKWWQKSEPTYWKLNQKNNNYSWEASFARYLTLIEKEIDDASLLAKNGSFEKIVILKGRIRHHQIDLIDIYEKTIASVEDKQYLLSMSNDIFSYLLSKFDKTITSYSASELVYYLNQIINSKEYGIYNVILDATKLPKEFHQNNEVVFGKYHLAQDEDLSENQFIKFTNLKIDSSAKTLILKFKNDVVTIENNDWKDQFENTDSFDSQEAIYRYQLDLPIINPGYYLLSFDYRLNDIANIRLEKVASNKEGKNTQIIFKEPLFVRLKTSFSKPIIFEKDDQSFYQIILESKNSISVQDLSTISIQLQPIFDPEIILEKIKPLDDKLPVVKYSFLGSNQYKIEAKNLTLRQEKVLINSLKPFWFIKSQIHSPEGNQLIAIFWPDRAVLVVTICILILLLFTAYYCLMKKMSGNKINWIDNLKNNVFSFPVIVRKSVIKAFQLIVKFLIIKSTKKRLLVIFLFIFTFILSFIQKDRVATFFVYLASFFWLIIIISYNINEISSFAIALVSLAVIPLFLTFKLQFFADKLAFWAISLIFTGSIHTIILFSSSTLLEKNPLSMLPLLIYNDLKPSYDLSQYIIKISRLLALGIRKIILFYVPFVKDRLNSFSINKATITRRDVALFIIKITLTFIIIWEYIIINKYISRIFYVRDSYPKILSAEPKLVYVSNKILFKGYNFGLKQYEGKDVRLMSQYGDEVVNAVSDVWTDSQIILTIPLSWKLGNVNFWLEKPFELDGQHFILKSNIVNIKLISRDNGWDEEDDLYFEQLKHLDKEVLEINGYKP